MELTQLVADLPAQTPPPPPARISGYRLALRIEWLAWLTAGLMNLVVWGAVSTGTGDAVYFWPMWVIGPWGVVLLGRELAARYAVFGSPPAQRPTGPRKR